MQKYYLGKAGLLASEMKLTEQEKETVVMIPVSYNHKMRRLYVRWQLKGLHKIFGLPEGEVVGEKTNTQARLEPKQVVEIFRRVKTDKDYEGIGKEYGVTGQTVYAIGRKLIWASLLENIE